MPKPSDTPGEGSGGPAADARSASPPRATDATLTAVRPFLEAHHAYFRQLSEGWEASQRGLKDACGAHAKGSASLLHELKQSITETARRYEEALRAALQAAQEERRGAAASACSRYHTDVSLAYTAAALKWIALQQELQTTVRRLQQSHVDRSRTAYHGYLAALKAAWPSVDVEQFPAALLAYIDRLGDAVVRCAWYTARA